MEGPFNDPQIPDGECTCYRALIGGEEAGTGEVVVEHAREGDHEIYRQTATARVAGENETRGEVIFRRRSGSIHAERASLEVSDADGRAIAKDEGRFRGVKVVQWGGKSEPYPRDLVPILGCAVALRGLEFDVGATRGLSVWLASSFHWEATAKVEKHEKIEVPAGEFTTWRVRLRPSFEQVDRALDSLMDALMPPLIAHLDAQAPHRFLRFEFPTGPFKWNPRGVIEATELATG